MPQLYTFIKDKDECTFIEGCKFVGNAFQTSREDIADRLRRSRTFGKTVKELTEKPNKAAKDGHKQNIC